MRAACRLSGSSAPVNVYGWAMEAACCKLRLSCWPAADCTSLRGLVFAAVPAARGRWWRLVGSGVPSTSRVALQYKVLPCEEM
jgi:hypothetical protein